MFKSALRVGAFGVKELYEIIFQPRLILSLIVGPFLIMLIFGLGYTGNQPTLRVALVADSQVRYQIPMDDLTRAISRNFTLEGVYETPEAAMEQLHAGNVDLVQIIPSNVTEQTLQGTSSPVQFTYDTIDPYTESWIIHLGYVQVSEMNRALLIQQLREVQEQIEVTEEHLTTARYFLDRLELPLSAEQRRNAQETFRELNNVLELLRTTVFLLPFFENTQDIDITRIREQIEQTQGDLLQLEQTLSDTALQPQQEEVAELRTEISTLETALEQWGRLPPEVIVSPLQRDYENLQGTSYDEMIYYAPGVLMLVIQHLAITLGALSLVRERIYGTFDLYRVAPVSMWHILLGKYLGYTVLLLVLALLLLALMVWGLGTPFLGQFSVFVVALLLFILASLGIGFFFSVVSHTDNQAIQFSMLSLLASLFFSSFILPLDDFVPFVQAFGFLLPLTHGIDTAHRVMLRGDAVALSSWLALSAIALVGMVVVLVLGARQLRRS